VYDSLVSIYVVSYPYVVKVTDVSTQIWHFLSTLRFARRSRRNTQLKMYMVLSMNFTF